MNEKYQIGKKYSLNVFLKPEKMEYLGKIKTRLYDGNFTNIEFDVFKRYSYGRPDLIAIYNGKFFARSYDNTIEDLIKDIGMAFKFKGKGYTHILVGNIRLTIEQFKEQTKNLLTKKEIEEIILEGEYIVRSKNGGEIKWCPQCLKIRQTTCCACGCGNCNNCQYRWVCVH